VRVLVVSQYFWPENFRVNELTASLVERGHEVTVLTGLPNYPEGKVFEEFVEQPSRYADFRGANVLRVPMMPRGSGPLRLVLNYVSFALSASLLGPVRLRGRRFDMIFVFETSPVTVGIPSSLLRAWFRAPVVFWVLDQWPETLQAVGVVRSPRILRLVGSLVRWIYGRCDLVLSQSKSLIPLIRAYCDGQDKVRYFPNWTDLESVHAVVEPAAEIPRAPGVFTVLYAGNIGDAQDFPAVLRAVELLRDDPGIRWIIVGEGRAADWLSDEIDSRGLSGRVLLPGRFPPERMAAVYRHADALLVSLRADPLFAMTVPGKLQTYLGVGLPVVAMLDGEGGDIVREAGAGIACAAGDSVGLADAVRRLAAMAPEERGDIGRRARAYSLQEFDRRRLIDRLEGWFEELAPRAPDLMVRK
jgi:glycosyltransferase involved in cell wall biosynthesis